MITNIKIKDFNIYQDTELQSVTIDSLLIADFVKINRKSKKILDIGAGNGIISILLSKKTNAKIHGVEILKRSYDLAIKNIIKNNLNIEMFNDDIQNFYKSKHQQYDIIVSNPPYFDFEKNENQMKRNIEKQIARNEKSLTIEKLISVSSFMLKNNGHLYLVIRSDKLFKVFAYLKKYKLIPKVLKFVYTKNDANAKMVLLDCAKNVNEGLVVENSIYVYDENNEKSQYVIDLYN